MGWRAALVGPAELAPKSVPRSTVPRSTKGEVIMHPTFEYRRIGQWLAAGIVAGACLISSPCGISTAAAEPMVEVRVAPPAARVEVVPRRPSPRHFWVHGYWAWNGRAHVWVPGRYVVERRGYEFRESHWEENHGHWRFHHGGWYRR